MPKANNVEHLWLSGQHTSHHHHHHHQEQEQQQKGKDIQRQQQPRSFGILNDSSLPSLSPTPSPCATSFSVTPLRSTESGPIFWQHPTEQCNEDWILELLSRGTKEMHEGKWTWKYYLEIIRACEEEDGSV